MAGKWLFSLVPMGKLLKWLKGKGISLTKA
jgi:hypothetical protein